MANLGVPSAVDAHRDANPVDRAHHVTHGHKRIRDSCKAAGDDWDVHAHPDA